MNIRTLQIFQTVCEEGNITRAANKLYMTQPAVSHAIKDLEDELQVRLFDRYGKRISLNTIGKAYLTKVQRVLLAFDDLEKVPLTLQESTTIRIGSSITIANDHLPEVLKSFHELYPSVTTKVYVESASKILNRLKQHTIDIALVEGVVSNKEWKQILFSSYTLQFICSKSHPLAQYDTLHWDMIKQIQWLLREKGSATRDTFDSACRIHQIVIEPLWTSVNSQALLQGVRQNLGATILPDTIIENCSFKDELHIVTMAEETFCNDNHIVYDKGIFLSEPLKKLLEFIQNKSA